MQESALRDEICELGRSIFERGLTHGSTGNISARCGDGWLLTPTGSNLGRLDPARLSKLDWNGKILGWFGKWGNNPDSNDIGEAHQLAVSKDLKTIYVADSLLAHVLKIETN